MSNTALLLLLFTTAVNRCLSSRVYFDRCGKGGFNCVTSKIFPGKNEILFDCNALNSWDVEIYLWQFRAPLNICSFAIHNCTKVRLNLQCTGDNRAIQIFHVKNVTSLQLIEPAHGVSLSAPEMIFEDIGIIDNIAPRTFTQIKQYQYKFGCFTPVKELEKISFNNVSINTIQREAFHKMMNVSKFHFINLTIGRMFDAAVQVFLAPNADFSISKCKIDSMEHLSVYVRGDNVTFNQNHFGEVHSSGINATVNTFAFIDNTVEWTHCRAFAVLARSVQILDNTFNYLGSCALQGIGPGLPENALQGFGKLKFLYEFKNNMVESLEAGSLHSDWDAYKNVGSNLILSYNSLRCSCIELAWLGTKEGYGKQYSSLDEFHEILLKKENKNVCIGAPCVLPIDAVRAMSIKNGRCLHNVTLQKLCDLYYPTTVKHSTVAATTRRTTVKQVNFVSFHKRLRSGACSEARVGLHWVFFVGWLLTKVVENMF